MVRSVIETRLWAFSGFDESSADGSGRLSTSLPLAECDIEVEAEAILLQLCCVTVGATCAEKDSLVGVEGQSHCCLAGHLGHGVRLARGEKRGW
jgi:hypothetical protein